MEQMEIMRIFALFDVKAECHLQPFFARTRAHALRTFGDMVADAESVVGRHPGDFSLIELGKVDILSGAVEGSRTNLASGETLVRNLHLVEEES